MSRKIKDIPISPLLEKTALKPCPFCGGEAHIFQIQENSKLQSRLWVVRCPVCGANQLPFSEKHYAVEAWNRRAE